MGQFSVGVNTPSPIVKLIVEILEPFHGEVLDQACGSGGMFVQSARFVSEHRRDPGAELRNISDFYVGGTIDWFKTGELNDWFVQTSNEKVTLAALDQTSLKTFPAGTVLMAMYGDGRTITSLGILRSTAASNQACAAMIVDRRKRYPLYFFYALKAGRHLLVGLALDGAHRNPSGRIVKDFRLPVPGLVLQRRIVGILSAYNDLIENCQRRIRILEDMARGLYRGLGSEIADEVHTEPAWVIRGTDISAARTADLQRVPHRVHSTSNIKSRRLQSDDVVFEVSGGSQGQLVGRAALMTPQLLSAFGGNDVICARFCKRVQPDNDRYSSVLLDLAIEEVYTSGQIEKLQVQSTGIFNFKWVEYLQQTERVVPPVMLQDDFRAEVEPLFGRIGNIGRRISNLRKTRDLLLPRLLSGQISVGDAADQTQDQTSATAELADASLVG